MNRNKPGLARLINSVACSTTLRSWPKLFRIASVLDMISIAGTHPKAPNSKVLCR